MKYLFIGGPKDAERIEVDDKQSFQRIVEMERVSFNDWNYSDPINQRLNVVEYIYKKHPFNGKDGAMYYAFVYKDIDPMEMLISGYRKGKRRSKKKTKLY